VDGAGRELDTLVLRVAGGLGLSALGLAATLDGPASAQALVGLGNLGVTAVASWHLAPAGRWTTVALAAAGWTGATLDPRVLDWRPGTWSVSLGPLLGDGAVRLGALAALSVTVTSVRAARRRVLRTEDALALRLLRERDSARRDRLTRLWNARYLHEALELEIARARRYGRPFGLLLLDLDGFKAVNDSAGHLAGDAVLQAVGRAIRRSCRATDVPARLGGDEFVVILPEASRLTVPRYAERLVAEIARAPFPPGLPRVTASVGAVAFDRAPATARAALAVADEAMYAAKRDGKNRYAVTVPEGSP
jgi:diguanylate cyclase (GGDEF)-like protein